MLVGALMLLRMLQRRQRAGAAAELAHLEKAAVTDPLTGLRNRRTFDDDLARALAKGRVCLVMLDLDGLKQTNERLGHAVGDERIRAVSAAVRAADCTRDRLPPRRRRVRCDPGRLRSRRRPSLRPSRPGCDARAARRRRPSVAVGVAMGEMRCPAGDLMRRADTALLAAKRMTSQICVHSPELDLATLEPITGGRRQDDLAVAFAAAVDAKDGDGYDHSRSVADLAGDIGEMVGLSVDEIELVRTAGLVHDVGYLDVDDSIFAKDEQPTDAEWDELASHAERGARILARCGFGQIAEWVRLHHERIDGGGYPDGLAGDAIPLEARILHVADADEATTRGRSYQTRMTGEQALAELERLVGHAVRLALRGGAAARDGAPRRLPERRALRVDRHVPRLGRDALEPGADRGVSPELEPALPGHVRVRVERDVRDPEAVADEERAIPAEAAVHGVERSVAGPPRGGPRSRRAARRVLRDTATQNRTTAIVGSRSYCSKKSHREHLCALKPDQTAGTQSPPQK